MRRIAVLTVTSTLLVMSCALFRSTRGLRSCSDKEVIAAMPQMKSALVASLALASPKWARAGAAAIAPQEAVGACALQEIVAETQREVDGWAQVQSLSCVTPEAIAAERRQRVAQETQLARAEALLATCHRQK